MGIPAILSPLRKGCNARPVFDRPGTVEFRTPGRCRVAADRRIGGEGSR